MAVLRKPLTSTETAKLGVREVRKEYTALANDYKRILDNDFAYCPFCGEWKSASANFYKSQWTKDGYHHYACKECILEQATDKNKDGQLVDNIEKTKTVLMRMDLPFLEQIYQDMSDRVDKTGIVDRRGGTIVFTSYMTVIKSFPQYNQLTWKDSKFSDNEERIDQLPSMNIRKSIIKLFGDGFTTAQYAFLQNQYDDWKARTQIDTKSQETYIINICMIQLQIYEAQKAGKDISKLLTTLNQLMDAAKLQPKQNVGNSSTDGLTFGELIEKWEQEKPIPEPEPEFRDVDGIKKFIDVYFKGHLAKAFGLKNGYSNLYDEEINKYKVEKPKPVEGEVTSDDIYGSLFGVEGE